MKIEVNVEKRYFLIILGIIFLLIGGLVYAFGGSEPSVMGHNVEEINWSNFCYCIQCKSDEGKWGAEQCSSFGNYTDISLPGGTSDDDHCGCKMKIYLC